MERADRKPVLPAGAAISTEYKKTEDMGRGWVEGKADVAAETNGKSRTKCQEFIGSEDKSPELLFHR